jgi:hypothetical protein
MAYLVAFSPCFVHKLPFLYQPDLVTSVPIDPVTGQAPDTGGDPDRAVRVPVCPACCKLINILRAADGLELLDERDSLERARELYGGYG